VMGTSYPGGGATLGAGSVFAYVAAKHASSEAGDRQRDAPVSARS
jgi:hypothetical protein